MKKALILSALVLCAGMVFAQRPAATVKTNTAKATATKGATLNAGTTYAYTITEMSIPNVTVMDAAATVRQDGKADKLKVTVNGNDGINYYIYDANDQAVSKNYFKTASTSIDMSSFQPGEYRIQLLDKKGAEKNFKVIKKQK